MRAAARRSAADDERPQRTCCRPIATGLPASPGVASGPLVTDPAAADPRRRGGHAGHPRPGRDLARGRPRDVGRGRRPDLARRAGQPCRGRGPRLGHPGRRRGGGRRGRRRARCAIGERALTAGDVDHHRRRHRRGVRGRDRRRRRRSCPRRAILLGWAAEAGIADRRRASDAGRRDASRPSSRRRSRPAESLRTTRSSPSRSRAWRMTPALADAPGHDRRRRPADPRPARRRRARRAGRRREPADRGRHRAASPSCAPPSATPGARTAAGAALDAFVPSTTGSRTSSRPGSSATPRRRSSTTTPTPTTTAACWSAWPSIHADARDLAGAGQPRRAAAGRPTASRLDARAGRRAPPATAGSSPHRASTATTASGSSSTRSSSGSPAGPAPTRSRPAAPRLDTRRGRVILLRMKTAVSVPDDLFEEVDRLARRSRRSRTRGLQCRRCASTSPVTHRTRSPRRSTRSVAGIDDSSDVRVRAGGGPADPRDDRLVDRPGRRSWCG